MALARKSPIEKLYIAHGNTPNLHKLNGLELIWIVPFGEYKVEIN